MSGNANKVVLALAAALTAVLLVLVISSGGSHGGGGGTAPSQQADVASEQQGQARPDETEAPQQTATPDYDPSAERQMSLEELERELENSTVPVGDNPRDAATSTKVPTTSEAYGQAAERGFGDLQLMADFSLDGSYSDPHPLDASSADRYPSYKMLYTAQTGVIWAVYVNEGAYLAIPLGTPEQQIAKEIILSESDVVTQYDGSRNQYSDFPLSGLTDEVGVRVQRIDAATLDSYSLATLAAM